MKFLKTLVPLWLVLVIFAGVGAGLLFSICSFKDKSSEKELLNSTNANCGIIRYVSSRHGEFTHPLLMADSPSESNELSELKSRFIETIKNNNVSGSGVNSTSIYYRELNLLQI